MANPKFSTLKSCREWLDSQGFQLHGIQTPNGRRYSVLNFRGGRCFEGSRQELIDELTAGWFRYV